MLFLVINQRLRCVWLRMNIDRLRHGVRCSDNHDHKARRMCFAARGLLLGVELLKCFDSLDDSHCVFAGIAHMSEPKIVCGTDACTQYLALAPDITEHVVFFEGFAHLPGMHTDLITSIGVIEPLFDHKPDCFTQPARDLERL